MEDYTTQKNILNNQFDTKWTEAKAAYAESKINNTTTAETHQTQLKTILEDLTKLKEQVQESIQDTQLQLQGSISDDGIAVPVKEDHSVTAEQMMKDSKYLFDQHRILLLIKVAIVLLIIVKGNSIYAEYKQTFVGACLAVVFSYLMFVRFA